MTAHTISSFRLSTSVSFGTDLEITDDAPFSVSVVKATRGIEVGSLLMI